MNVWKIRVVLQGGGLDNTRGSQEVVNNLPFARGESVSKLLQLADDLADGAHGQAGMSRAGHENSLIGEFASSVPGSAQANIYAGSRGTGAVTVVIQTMGLLQYRVSPSK